MNRVASPACQRNLALLCRRFTEECARQPSVWNLDFSAFRNIRIGLHRVELRAQASNLLNHPRWGNPNTNFNSPTFMQIFAVDTPRTVQLGLRFQF